MNLLTRIRQHAVLLGYTAYESKNITVSVSLQKITIMYASIPAGSMGTCTEYVKSSISKTAAYKTNYETSMIFNDVNEALLSLYAQAKLPSTQQAITPTAVEVEDILESLNTGEVDKTLPDVFTGLEDVIPLKSKIQGTNSGASFYTCLLDCANFSVSARYLPMGKKVSVRIMCKNESMPNKLMGSLGIAGFNLHSNRVTAHYSDVSLPDVLCLLYSILGLILELSGKSMPTFTTKDVQPA